MAPKVTPKRPEKVGQYRAADGRFSAPRGQWLRQIIKAIRGPWWRRQTPDAEKGRSS